MEMAELAVPVPGWETQEGIDVWRMAATLCLEVHMYAPQVEMTQEEWSLVRSLCFYVCDLRLHSAIVTENLKKDC